MNFYVRHVIQKKLAEKMFGGKFNFLSGGWVGPDVLLSE